MNAINHKLSRCLLAVAMLIFCSLTQAEDTDDVLDLGDELEYVELDEILSEDNEQPAAEAKAAKAAAQKEQADEEFVDLNDILYGSDNPASKEARQAAKEPQTLQGDMQDLKKKILNVNRDMFVLEEDLLFPSSTQVNVFVAFDALEYFQLDGVTLKINDRPISNHLYTERELKALNRGAVQRLFTGNLPVGEHELVAIVTGVGPEGRDYRRAVSMTFEKTSGAKYIELKIEGDDLRKQPDFRIKQWE